MATLANVLPRNSATAIIVPAQGSETVITLSFNQLQRCCEALQQSLAALGIGHDSAVSIALPNSLEFIVAFLAASWQRAIAAPLNPAYKQSEFEFYIQDLNSAFILVPKGAYAQNTDAVQAGKRFNAAIAECYWDGQEVKLDVKERGSLQNAASQSILSPKPEDVALVLHTSGTTGRPKAVPLSHRNLTTTMSKPFSLELDAADEEGNIRVTYNLSPLDRTYLVMPLFHVHGLLAGFLSPLHSGGSVIVPLRFSARDFWRHFITYKANWYTAVPTIHQILLKSPLPNPIPSIRFIRSCSSPLSPKIFYNLQNALHAPVLEAYAMTEAAHQMTSNPLPPAKRIPGSVGKGQGVKVVILAHDSDTMIPTGQNGEICIKGENVTAGYVNNPSANAASFTASGYFRTGDQGYLDSEGYVFITGRIKELINKGGEKISPIELDNVLISHPDIGEAVSFAMEDEHYGQEVGAAIVLKNLDSQLTEDELKTWMSGKVAKFKIPKRIYFTKVMPKTATGKIQRRQVADAMSKLDNKALDAPRARL